MWNKHSCFETSMHTPLFVSVPSSVAPEVTPGTRTAALTEFIDIYPSLCELTGIQIPDHVEGTSFVDTLRHPDQSGKPAAVGRFMRGDTIRTEHLRYSEYRGNSGAGELTGRMLYDHRVDPNENVNVVDQPDLASTVSAISEDLNRLKGKQQSGDAAPNRR
jgi:arylsulfatase A-like enzyme